MAGALVYTVGTSANCFPYLATEQCHVLPFYDAEGCVVVEGVEPPRWATNAGTRLCIDDGCSSCPVSLVDDAAVVCTAVPELSMIYRVFDTTAAEYTLNGASCRVYDGLEGFSGGTFSTGYIIVAAMVIGAAFLHRVLRPPAAQATAKLRL